MLRLMEWVIVPSALFPIMITLYCPETAGGETLMVNAVDAVWLYFINTESAARLAVISLLVVVVERFIVPLKRANE